MDLSLVVVVFYLFFVDYISPNRHNDMWEELSLRFGMWKKLPRSSHEAERLGYHRVNDICKTDRYHGFLYRRNGDTKDIPIYDLNGWIAGIQAMIPAYMKGFNSLNETIALPPYEIQPPVLDGYDPEEPGRIFYTITAYFKHPKLICSPISQHHVQTGKGLYIQMGSNPITHSISIPLETRHLSSMWVKGPCLPRMGTHYFYNLSRDLPCEKIYPVFLMYDSEGKLSAFGWSFQGFALDTNDKNIPWFKLRPDTYRFTFDINTLPPCMFNENFQVFGIHIWLEPPNSETMLCKSPQPVEVEPRTTKAPSAQVTYNPGYNTNIIKANQNSGNSSSYNSFNIGIIILLLICSYFTGNVSLL